MIAPQAGVGLRQLDNTFMKPAARIALVLVTVAVTVGCDLKTKSLAREHLPGQDTLSFLGDTIRLDYTENPGAFLGLGGSLSSRWRTALFSTGAALGIAAILGCALFVPRLGTARFLALTLIGSGGIGNVIDRVWYDGYVRDFLNIGLGPVRSGIFNVADVLLVAGCVLFFVVREEGLQSRHGSWSSGPGNGVAGTP